MASSFMARAIELAIENARSGRGGPFGAVIVRAGEVVAEGQNQVTQQSDPTAHGEIVAIRNACTALGSFELRGCDLYTSCEPCPMCLGAIYWARISRVYFGCVASDASDFGFDDSWIYREIATPLTGRQLRMEQLMREEALAAFRAWSETPNKTPY